MGFSIREHVFADLVADLRRVRVPGPVPGPGERLAHRERTEHKVGIELPVPQQPSFYLIGARDAVPTRLVEQFLLPEAEPEAEPL